MKQTTFGLLVGACLLAAAACGGADDSDDSDTSARDPIAPEEGAADRPSSLGGGVTGIPAGGNGAGETPTYSQLDRKIVVNGDDGA